MSFVVPPGGFAGFSQMTPASRAALGKVGGNGGGRRRRKSRKVKASGGGKRRILYQNTCDKALVWTTSHCQDQESPQLVVQNLTFADGNATGETVDGGGGGAIFVRGGQFKVVNSQFVRNPLEK